MIRMQRCTALGASARCGRVVGISVRVVAALWLQTAVLLGQQPGVHYLHQGVMPPGAIGSRQLQRGGPLPGYFQPVEIKAPPGALVSLATEGYFEPAAPTPQTVGMLIGGVYRLKVTNIQGAEGQEVFPTVEVIDRTYPPRGQELRFAIPVELTLEDLRLALAGKFVTRVVYLENPRNAMPAPEDPREHNWFEAGPGRDPLAVADALGRPVAILRLGARMPKDPQEIDGQFLFGSPPLMRFSSHPRAMPALEDPVTPGQEHD
jgi:hypothetical protein